LSLQKFQTLSANLEKTRKGEAGVPQTIWYVLFVIEANLEKTRKGEAGVPQTIWYVLFVIDMKLIFILRFHEG